MFAWQPFFVMKALYQGWVKTNLSEKPIKFLPSDHAYQVTHILITAAISLATVGHQVYDKKCMTRKIFVRLVARFYRACPTLIQNNLKSSAQFAQSQLF